MPVSHLGLLTLHTSWTLARIVPVVCSSALTATGLGCIAWESGESGERTEPVQLPEGLVLADKDFPV